MCSFGMNLLAYQPVTQTRKVPAPRPLNSQKSPFSEVPDPRLIFDLGTFNLARNSAQETCSFFFLFRSTLPLFFRFRPVSRKRSFQRLFRNFSALFFQVSHKENKINLSPRDFRFRDLYASISSFLDFIQPANISDFQDKNRK